MKAHILISGASSGIGRAIAIEASRKGYKLSLCGRDKVKLAETLLHLSPDSQVYTDTFCLSETNKIHAFVSEASKVNGNVNILINCAGLNSARGLGNEVELADLDWMMKINCYAPIEFCKAVLPPMQAMKSGRIINVLSTVCLYSNPGIAAYTASKSALDAYMKVMRKEQRTHNIHFTSVYPGGVNTDFRAAERPQYLSAEAVAKPIIQTLKTNASAHLHELVIRPQAEENY
ncbi:SDR family oxidoreductase [Gayadomonas joobiniege]|uniref:SDR family oxidoreductase n=1 Tax=Gayadomonas joobiniege TaxID=1234606 RepID=UPI00037B3969|nr:SDR family oxidoreductase [Gayadomonas joobiniege]